MDTVIEVTDLRKTYGSKIAVDDVSFHVERGEIFGIVGPNGAGKTSTVECVMGLRRPDSGTVRVLGLDPQRDGMELRRNIGVQLQQASLPNRIKVWEALQLFSSFYDTPVDWRELLEQWGLADQRNAMFSKLSGGQKQRLFIALALVNEPKVVFFDELTTGLDPQARHATWDLIRSIRNQGTTVLLVTHFMEEVENLCDRVAVIDHGRLVALDTPVSLVNRDNATAQVKFTLPNETDLSWLAAVRGVSRVERSGHAATVHGDGPLMARVAAALAEHGIEPPDLRMEKATLEEVFLNITGRSLRD